MNHERHKKHPSRTRRGGSPPRSFSMPIQKHFPCEPEQGTAQSTSVIPEQTQPHIVRPQSHDMRLRGRSKRTFGSVAIATHRYEPSPLCERSRCSASRYDRPEKNRSEEPAHPATFPGPPHPRPLGSGARDEEFRRHRSSSLRMNVCGDNLPILSEPGAYRFSSTQPRPKRVLGVRGQET